ncbi:MAG: hypothetical protein MEQ74_05090 [Paracoccus sp.]|nr:hypothetical protein [Paracoccus sp. (in: a-proteobacteria)]
MSKNARENLAFIREQNARLAEEMREQIQEGLLTLEDYYRAMRQAALVEASAKAALEKAERLQMIGQDNQPADKSSILDNAAEKAFDAFQAGIAFDDPTSEQLAKCAGQLRSTLENIAAVRRLVDAKKGCGMATCRISTPFAGFVS